ncbi:DUF4097 domain-containing protein [Brevibacillus ruminantium]|uniref:DUF4097 domain-containing protein n=1 Tax=Brevibacillus ruminantium TaxID=2950604 RepID=A0ABY4WAG1_9BACL|nr:DUF4097 family beta strand repeat-containing protein [Brevibacillus ruminantium]USG64153.1 DUF4097 domain-containing protein [Brevibacillus ruminantium]
MKRLVNGVFGFFALLFLIGVIGLIWQYNQTHDMKLLTESVDEKRTIEKPITGLEVDTDTADVVLSTGNQPEASIRLIGDINTKQKDRLEFLTEVTPEGILQVKLREHNGVQIGFFLPVSRKLELQVMVPEAVYEKIMVTSATGDFRISSLQAKEARMRTSTGDIVLAGFVGDSLEIKTDTGNMDIASAQGKIDITSVTGDIKRLVLEEMKQDVNVSTNTGDIKLTIRNLPSEAQVSLFSDTGDLEVDWPQLTITDKGKHKLTGAAGTGGPNLKVRSTTGDIRIRQ